MGKSFTFVCVPVERWLPVVGYENVYQVSDQGRVRGVRRKGACGGLLRPGLAAGDRWTVALCLDGKQKTRLVHHLVLEAFVGLRPPGEECCHGPKGSRDNRLINIEWGTKAKNQGPDKERDGSLSRGERNGGAKLTASGVVECRERYAAGETQGSLAREFGVDQSTLSMAIAGKNWRHVGDVLPKAS